MKYSALLLAYSISILMFRAQAQGLIQNLDGTVLTAFIADAPTRIGSIDGPLAGPNIYAQVFAGLQQDSLQPVQFTRRHGIDEDGNPSGVANIMAFTSIPEGSGGYVRAGVWDASVWGDNIADVPQDQIGFTEILKFSPAIGSPPPPLSVRFQQTAVVPAIPEPATWVLLLGGGMIMAMRRQCVWGATVSCRRQP